MTRSSADRNLIAIDLGSESCRVSLLQWIGGEPEVQIVHRFSNDPVSHRGKLVWDVERMYRGIVQGVRQGAQAAEGPIAAIGIDGWSVDYVRLAPYEDESGIVGEAFCYRDERTIEASRRVHERISPERLYERTGLQFLRFNTLYQLYADGRGRGMQQLHWVLLPEYLLYRLGARRIAEFTNATHSELVRSGTHEWDEEIFRAAELEVSAAPKIVAPGTIVGLLAPTFHDSKWLRDTKLIAPACHDTASAIAGIAATGDDWAFISSGTWSLVGTPLPKPCVTSEAREKNFTNLGGVGGKTYFLKNINGMWLLRQCIEQWRSEGHPYGLEPLIAACETMPAPQHLLDVDDPALLLPGAMHTKINAQQAQYGAAPFGNDFLGAVHTVNLILHSLAARYAAVLRDLTAVTGKQLRNVHIVGGGSNNQLLNRLTAERTGLPVHRGNTESSTIGNFAIQLARLEDAYNEKTGVAGDVVSRWAAMLAHAPIRSAFMVPTTPTPQEDYYR